MSSVAVTFQYRCTRCWQTLVATTEDSGTNTECRFCGHQMTIPEATPERIQRAQSEAPAPAPTPAPAPASAAGKPSAAPFGNPPNAAAQAYPSRDIPISELERQIKQQMSLDPANPQMLAAYTSSRIKRFFGFVVNGLAMTLAYVVGIALMIGLMSIGFINVELLRQANGERITSAHVLAGLVLFFPVIGLLVVQWNMIATQGQSIGKKLLGMRILRHDGSYPGFFQGVILRNWLRVLLGFVPLFSLVDVLFIFGDSNRCLHDFLAGTRVVDAEA